MNAQTLADQLRSKGFATKVLTSTGVKVWLNNRNISTLEVQRALYEIFGYWNAFNVTRIDSHSILVSE